MRTSNDDLFLVEAQTLPVSVPGPDGAAQAESPEALYSRYYVTLVRTAALMTDDRGLAEEVVQEAFAQILTRWATIEPGKRLAYLYRSVANGARSTLRRRRTARSYRPEPQLHQPGADAPVLQAAGYEALLAAVAVLPPRQRQVLVLRFYAELSVADTAEALGIKPAAVSVATHHALKALHHLRGELS